MECLTGDLPCFGYQRGEWLSLGEKECWLWLYGHLALSEAFDPAPETLAEVKQLLATYLPEINEIIAEKKEYCEQHGLDPQEHLGLPDTLFTDYYNPFVIHEARGLDLLNAETGELVPDGIPDGICLLYKLRDGEVVEVMRAEEI